MKRILTKRQTEKLILSLLTLLFTYIGIYLQQNFKQPDILGEKSDKYYVERVVDGDTIVVRKDNVSQNVRLIGVDTPELNDPRSEIECFAKEASQKTADSLLGKFVTLESDLSQDDKDRYGRLLRYVFLEDGTNYNELLIKEGYAYEYTYDVAYKYQVQFKNAQKFADENNLGLWGAACAE